MENEPSELSIGCPMHINRRTFLAGCAAGAGGMAALHAATATVLASPAPSQNAAGKARVRLVFTHISPERPTWPNINYDYEGRKKELTARLVASCPEIEFLPATAQTAEEADKLLEQDENVDGYVVYIVGIWTGAVRKITSSGRPVVIVDDLYAGSGEFLIEYARAQREQRPVTGVSSTEFQDVVDAVNCLACMRKLRRATILDVTDRPNVAEHARAITEVLGIGVRQIPGAELEEAYNRTDTAEAARLADGWIKRAEKMIEPTRAEVVKSARMYLAMKDLLKKYDSEAITIDCLGLFYAGKMSAYPCMGFWQLNNAACVGACEADLKSTATMVVVTTLTGRPGYISDPVIDTSRNQVIYAHCVAPTKVFGPAGPENPYHIRSHAEDLKGACVRSLMPLDEMTTTLEISPWERKVLVHQGRTVANIDEPKACRNKLAVEVADARKMMTEWDRWGWHRVTFYGDLRPQIEHFSALMGLEVIEEG